MPWYEIPVKYMSIRSRVQLLNIEGRSFCLVFNDDKWVAFSKSCPHAGAPLVDGWCEDGQIVCPFHRHSFDLKTGRGKLGQHNYIKIYQTKIEADRCLVYFGSSLWSRLFSK